MRGWHAHAVTSCMFDRSTTGPDLVRCTSDLDTQSATTTKDILQQTDISLVYKCGQFIMYRRASYDALDMY